MQSSSTCPIPSRKIRIIAKIQGYIDQKSESITDNSFPRISVFKHSEGESDEKVTISFGDQSACRKNAYDMDYCYGQNDDLGLIFAKEIKPLISVVFDGKNASIIAFGARGSGKTYTIQGSEDTPGLATLAMSEILSMAEESGKIIEVSMYEVSQDHVFDVLDSKCKKVQVFENAQGNIELRGISQVPINSISEFQKLYYSNWTPKAPEKIGLKVAQRSHKGLMIRVLSNNENSSTKLVGKMNFVDLAGYEDARKNSIDCTNLGENANINKSLYALLNVVYALNVNESRVPYRESKLSRVLQDSFGGSSRVLLLTCLNPFCQDTMYTVSLASRSLQGNNRVSDSVIRSSQSSAKLVQSSVKNHRLAIFSSTTKKENGSDSVIRSSTNSAKLVDSVIRSSTSSAKLADSVIRSSTSSAKLVDSVIRSSTGSAKLVQSSVKNRRLAIVSATTQKENGSDSIIRSGRSSAKQVHSSAKNGKLEIFSATTKKEKDSRVCFHKKNDGANGRKLFDDVIPSTTTEEAKLPAECSSAIFPDATVGVASSPKKEEGTIADVSLEIKEKETTSEPFYYGVLEVPFNDKETSPASAYNASEASLVDKVVSPLVFDSDLKALTSLEKEEKENKNSQIHEGKSPPLSARLRDLSNSLKSLCSSTPSGMMLSQDITSPFSRLSCSVLEPQTPVIEQNAKAIDKWELTRFQSPREIFNNRSSGMKQNLVKDCLQFINSASKDELKGLKGIGEKRATYILELREESPEPFKNLDDLQDIGLSAKQVKDMMKHVAGDLFN